MEAFLIKSGAQVNFVARSGDSVAGRALYGSSYALVDLIGKHGLSMQPSTPRGGTCFHSAAYVPAVHVGSGFSIMDAATCLVALRHVKIDDFDLDGFSALHVAILSEAKPAVARMHHCRTLIDLGANPNLRAADGRHPLELALRYSRCSPYDCVLVLELIERGSLLSLADGTLDYLVEMRLVRKLLLILDAYAHRRAYAEVLPILVGALTIFVTLEAGARKTAFLRKLLHIVKRLGPSHSPSVIDILDAKVPPKNEPARQVLADAAAQAGLKFVTTSASKKAKRHRRRNSPYCR
jgi:ankyrin repeat protein